jgi:uncharacterized RDD family membrane protein YckC
LDNINIENLQLATTRRRANSFIIDDLLVTLIVTIMLWSKISATNGDLEIVLQIMNEAFMQIIFLKIIYQAFFVWYYGATIGKIVMKLRVIDFNHFGRITFSQALIRSLLRIVSELFFYFGFIMAFFTDSKQTLHDKFGRTLVVNV